MKKIIALLLAMSMCFALVACSNTQKPAGDSNKPGVEDTDPNPAPQPDDPTGTGDNEQPTEAPTNNPDADETTNITMANTLLEDFKSKAGTMSAEELANELLANEDIQFMGGAAPVEAGYLNGFDNEISGFKTATMFGPMIGTIPFIGYIFELEDGADVVAFEQTLKDNANLRWNICTSADEMIVQSVDNTVFFVMAPYGIETNTPDESGNQGVDGDVPVTDEPVVEENVPTETTDEPVVDADTPVDTSEAETSEAPADETVPTDGTEDGATTPAA